MKSRLVLGMLAGWTVLLFLSTGLVVAEEPVRQDERLKEPVMQKLGQLESKIAALKAVGASDDDLRQVDQILRIAKGSAKRGQYVEADVNLDLGLQQIEKVAVQVATDTNARIQKMDDQVRFLLDDARVYLAKKPPEETWAKAKYQEAVKMAEQRNALAFQSGLAIPEKDFSPLFRPYRGLFETAPRAAIAEGETVAPVSKTKDAERYQDLVMRVRGNETSVFREAVQHQLTSQYDVARREYEQVLRDAPNDYKALFNLGVLEMQLGRPSAAVEPLKKAFDLGLKMDTLDVWKGNFVPEAGPLKEAYQQTGNGKLAEEVEAERTKRKEAIDAKERREREARIPKIEAPTPAPEESEDSEDEGPTSPEDKLKAKLKGKVALARPGATPQEVTDLIGTPPEVTAKGAHTLYYYPTGTVHFVDGKVVETTQRKIELDELK